MHRFLNNLDVEKGCPGDGVSGDLEDEVGGFVGALRLVPLIFNFIRRCYTIRLIDILHII